MKTERDNERVDEQIVNLLTPKHAPRCNVSFSVPETPKRVSWWQYVRTVGVAAVVMIGVFFGAKILMPGEARAAQIIDRAMAELQEIGSCRIELTYKPTETGGASTKVVNTILRTERGYLSRQEIMEDSGLQTVYLYTPDSTKMWSDGMLNFATSRRNQQIDLVYWITLDVMGKFNENKKNLNIVSETDSEITIRNEKRIHEYNYSSDGVFSKVDGLLKSYSCRIKSDDGFTVFIQSDRIDYTIPLTVDEITKAP